MTIITEPVWRDRFHKRQDPIQSIQLPGENRLEQDEEWCEVTVAGRPRRIRFHDYPAIYDIPGLYESLFYDRLKCCSPSRVVSLLSDVLLEQGKPPTELRVLDLGAGNGMVAEELDARRVGAVIGVDILPEARRAALRDRPGIYNDYLVTDLTEIDPEAEARIRELRPNCLMAVATLGFADTPVRAFTKAMRLIEVPGWLAFNIKDTFLKDQDDSGFSQLIHQLARRETIRFEAYRRYSHRRSVTGEALYYIALVSRILQKVPEDDELGI